MSKARKTETAKSGAKAAQSHKADLKASIYKVQWWRLSDEELAEKYDHSYLLKSEPLQLGVHSGAGLDATSESHIKILRYEPKDEHLLAGFIAIEASNARQDKSREGNRSRSKRGSTISNNSG